MALYIVITMQSLTKLKAPAKIILSLLLIYIFSSDLKKNLLNIMTVFRVFWQ